MITVLLVNYVLGLPAARPSMQDGRSYDRGPHSQGYRPGQRPGQLA